MFALIETSNSLNLFKDDRIVNKMIFKDVLHAHKIYESLIKGILPSEVSDFLIDNDVQEIIVDKSLLKANMTKDLKNIVFKEDSKKLRLLKEKLKHNFKSTRGLSHKIAHKNVNFYMPDPIIVQSFALLKQVELDMEKYDKRASEIYSHYLPELKIKKQKDECYDDKVQFKECFDIEVIQSLWKIKEQNITDKNLSWIKNSVGINLSDQDWENLQRIIDLFNLKKQNSDNLKKYLEEKIKEHAPNLYELIGYRLTAEIFTLCGSLVNLAKCSSGTVQVLGAEKALFRSLKSKTPTPKYGILKTNGLTHSARIIRSLASKIVLCARIDAFSSIKTNSYGKALREAIEKKIKDDKQIDTMEILRSISKKIVGKKSLKCQVDLLERKKKTKRISESSEI